MRLDLPEPAGEANTAHLGHDDIRQDEVDAGPRRDLQCRRWKRGLQNGVPTRLQDFASQRPDFSLILNEQDCFRAAPDGFDGKIRCRRRAGLGDSR